MHDRGAWLDEFEQQSAEFRHSRADDLRAKRVSIMRQRRGYERELRGLQLAQSSSSDPQGHPRLDELEQMIVSAERRIERYRRREEGQRRRVSIVRACGSKALRQLCLGCGHAMRPDQPVKCGHIRVCLCCRGGFANRRRAAFRAGRHSFLRSHTAWRLRKHSAPGGRWSDKFITLTVPHSGDPARDARELANAYKRYRRALISLLREEIRVPETLLRFPYVRVQEITPSDGGHAHYHLWCFLPFIPQPVHSFLWSRSLSHSYRTCLPRIDVATLLSRVEDVRSIRLMRLVFVSRRGSNGRALADVPLANVSVEAGRRAEDELIKYLVKDATRAETGTLEYIEPDLFARLYAALEGRRTIQASARFWVKAEPSDAVSCSECGTVHGKGHRPNTRLVSLASDQDARRVG